MFNMEKIFILIDWLRGAEGHTSPDNIISYINETMMPVMSDAGGNMNCIEGVSSDVFHFEDGIHLTLTQSYDSFGSSVCRSANLSIGNITEEKTLEIWSMEYTCVDEKVESEYHVASAEDLAAIIRFVKESCNNWSTSDHKQMLLSYLHQYNTTGVTAYGLLEEDDPLKKDADILAGLADKIYTESAAQYSDIVSYDAISPYGGEDITYYPSSAAECFFDHFHPSMESIGATAYFTERELMESAYSCLYRQGNHRAITQLIREYEADAQTLAAQDVVFNQFQLVKQKRNLCKRAKRSQERIEQADSPLPFLEYWKSGVEARKYPWWLKFFFRAAYRRNLRADKREIAGIKNRMVECDRVITRLDVEKSELYAQIRQLDAQLNYTTIQKFRSQNYFRKWLRKVKVRQGTDKALYVYCKELLAGQLEKSA